MVSKYSVPIALLAFLGTGFAQTVDGSKYNSPSAGPPASYFAAATTIPVAALQTAAAKASTAAQVATYPINGDSGAKKVTIHSDWSNFSDVGEPAYEIRN
jgi:chitosanase